ncbi:UNVERIFIED_CONTAM: cytochrome [Sesamum latifolium]|uniref:Cytochrome n=1 Tax=Sesamum latifolium TaxID=2727402 RepID=A0AAW2WCI5_9LAMI
MNAVMRMIAGKRYYGENVDDVEEARLFREIVRDTLRLGTSNMGDFLQVIRWLGVGGVEKTLVELERKREAFMQELVEGCKRRFKPYGGDGGEVVEEGKSKTMIEMLLALQAKEPDYYTDALIRSLMLVLLISGTDTSAGRMECTLSLLLNHPHVHKKAQLEINNHIGHDRLIDESDIAELPYLRCIVSDVMVCTMLLVNVWAIHNDPKNWEDAREFKPERFEGLEGNRDGFKLMPFGLGRRGCPGEALAVRMVGFGLGSMIQCFDWERVGKELVDMTEGLGLSMTKAEPLMAYCKARPVAAKLLSRFKPTMVQC